MLTLRLFLPQWDKLRRTYTRLGLRVVESVDARIRDHARLVQSLVRRSRRIRGHLLPGLERGLISLICGILVLASSQVEGHLRVLAALLCRHDHHRFGRFVLRRLRLHKNSLDDGQVGLALERSQPLFLLFFLLTVFVLCLLYFSLLIFGFILS